MWRRIRQHLMRMAAATEHYAAWLQGKGYGSATLMQEVAAIQQMLPNPQGLMIDGGAALGDYTAALLQHFPQAEMHLFEPSSYNLERLRRRFSNHARITIMPHALGHLSGQATLYGEVPGSGMASLTQRRLQHFGLHPKPQECVRVQPLEDYWIQQLQRRQIDLIKLDIEGHELAALHGCGEALQHTRLVQIEFGGCNLDTHTTWQDFWYFFKAHGFQLYRITLLGPEHVKAYTERDECYVTTNYIAVKS